MAEAILNDAQVKLLVITHADFFERKMRPLLPVALNNEFDRLLARAGNVYADVEGAVAPSVKETAELLGRLHVALPSGVPEKATLGRIMRETGLAVPTDRASDRKPDSRIIG